MAASSSVKCVVSFHEVSYVLSRTFELSFRFVAVLFL